MYSVELPSPEELSFTIINKSLQIKDGSTLMYGLYSSAVESKTDSILITKIL